MKYTTKSNSFEKISFRALIVISLLCVIFGGGLAYFEYYNAQSYWKLHHEYQLENDRRNTPEFNNCIKIANDGIQIRRCYEIYAPDLEELQRLTDAGLNANHWVSIGLVMLITPIPLLITYFLLRWILTGRWKKPNNK